MKKLFLLLLSAVSAAVMLSMGTLSTAAARVKVPKVNRNATSTVTRVGGYAVSHVHGVSNGQVTSNPSRYVPGRSAIRRNNVSVERARKNIKTSTGILHQFANGKSTFTPFPKPSELMLPQISQDELAYRKALERAFAGGYDSTPDSLLALVCEAERRNELNLADTLAKRITNLDSLTVAGIAYNVPRHSELKEKLRKKSRAYIESAYFRRIASGDRVDYIPDSLDRCEPYVCEMILVDRYVPRQLPLAKIVWSPDLVGAVDIFAEAADSIFAHSEDFDPELQSSVFVNLYKQYLHNCRYDEAQNLEDRAMAHLEMIDPVVAQNFMNRLVTVYNDYDDKFYDDPSDLSWPEWVIENFEDPAYMAHTYVNQLQIDAFGRVEGWKLPDYTGLSDKQKIVNNAMVGLARKGIECMAGRDLAQELSEYPDMNEDVREFMIGRSASSLYFLEETLCLLEARDRSKLASAIIGLQDIAKRVSTHPDEDFADRWIINIVHQAYLTLHLTGDAKDALKVLKKNRKLLKQPNVTDSAKEFYNECMAQLYIQLGEPDEAKKLRMFKADHTTRDDYFFNRNLSEMIVSPDFKRW